MVAFSRQFPGRRVFECPINPSCKDIERDSAS
jgi:hypothetical protein